MEITFSTLTCYGGVAVVVIATLFALGILVYDAIKEWKDKKPKR